MSNSKDGDSNACESFRELAVGASRQRVDACEDHSRAAERKREQVDSAVCRVKA